MAKKDSFPGPGPFFRATPRTHSIEAICTLLLSGRIVESGLIPWGSNYTFLVTMDVEQPHPLLAVYKPRRGESPLWDFPDGTLYKRECAAFLFSEALGWHLVPPTVIRQGPNGIGTIQLYMHHRPEDADYFALREQYSRVVQTMAVFDLIANNTDRKAGHCLLDDEGCIWGIDHGLTFHVQPKLRTVIWDFSGQRITKKLLRDIKRVCAELEQHTGVTGALEELLFAEEIDALIRRMRYLLAHPEMPSLQTRRGVPWPFY